MKNSEKDSLGSINFLDIDPESGKMLQIEDNKTDLSIPDVEISENNEREITNEMQSIINGTYIEDQQKAEAEAKKKAEEKKLRSAKFIVSIITIIAVVIASIYSFTTLQESARQRTIQERTVFLSANAFYANNTKDYFKTLTSNADNYQKDIIKEYSMKNKAKTVGESIEKEISRLETKKEDFDKYDASELYGIIYGRLNEAKNLAKVQNNGGKREDIAYKTNEFIINENENADMYNQKLKDYLIKSDIPFTETDKKISYSVDNQQK